MQVVRAESFQAWCKGAEGEAMVDMRLVGSQPEGTWVLVFLGTAREVLEPERAAQIEAALKGLRDAMSGSYDPAAAFADLVDREPQLPEFLREPT
ncbi:hydrogenase expression/formation protein HypC [Methylocaldum szegediense]|uniref:Hydrogenase expression/formation protein HypC n=2 Tax=Methylocaldum szegediense TaxID=73780 RepID=A0ABM9HWT3_9GAMM|nr:hydrogenase expression/formation protein HypC [Methylocaldum szegediense]